MSKVTDYSALVPRGNEDEVVEAWRKRQEAWNASEARRQEITSVRADFRDVRNGAIKPKM